MKNQVQVFMNQEFGRVGIIVNGNGVSLNLADICRSLGYTKKAKGNIYIRKDLVENIAKSLDITGLSVGDNNIKITKDIDFEEIWIKEDDFYEVCLESRAKHAKKFRKWVTSEVLPQIRQTGSYIAGGEKAGFNAVEKVLSNSNPESIDMIITLAERHKEVLIEKAKLEEENILLSQENERKSDIIDGFSEYIDIATMRRRLSDIIRHTGGKSSIADRWMLLYSEYGKVNKMNLNQRLQGAISNGILRKRASKIDYIDIVLDDIEGLYNLAVKIFESDVERLQKQWFGTVKGN